MLPKDPMILLSYINTKMRDEKRSLEDICREENVLPEQVEKDLASVGFSYNAEKRCFQ